MPREPLQYVEMDIDTCSLTYGTSPCTAVLGTTGTDKCFNLFATCQAKSAYTKTTTTVRFVNNVANLPVGFQAYPCLELNGISAFSSSVNIAGGNDKLGSFGRRATVTIKLKDFVSDDVLLDKYYAQRISGAAQSSGVGYNPRTRGTFFSKLKSRWPYYAGRQIRVIDTYLDDLANVKTRTYIITNISGPDSDGSVTIEGKDILALADDKRALLPKPSQGKLDANITVAAGQTFNLIPSGVETSYPTSGYATIGSEIVSFTRSGAVVTVTARGQFGTAIATHSVNDTFQIAYNISNMRIDDFLYDALVNYASVPAAYCPLTTNWRPQITKWMSGIVLNTVIAKPIGVAQLIGELSVLGVSIWWDDTSQTIQLQPNRPVTNEEITYMDDNNSIKAIEQDDEADLRITEVHFYTKQTDPTLDYKRKDNYNQINVLIDTDAESANAYGDTRVKEIFCRWFNNGADSIVGVLSKRLLKRFNVAPKTYKITLDAKDNTVDLVDVISLNSYINTDTLGLPVQQLVQVIQKTTKRSGHEVEVLTQVFDYNGRYGIITSNTTPVYSLATSTQKLNGGWLVGPSGVFSDGSLPYAFI